YGRGDDGNIITGLPPRQVTLRRDISEPNKCAPQHASSVLVEPILTGDGGEGLIKDIDAAHCLVLADDERWINANDVRIRHCDEPSLQYFVEKSPGNSALQRCFRRAIGNQFNANHQTTTAHVSDKTVLFLQRLQADDHQRSDSSRISDQFFMDNELNSTQAVSSSQRIPAVAGRTPARLSERFGGHAIEGRGNGADRKA